MREITPDPFKVYRLDELEPDARQAAIDLVAMKLSGDWWDEHNNDAVRETMVFALADALGTPGRENFGEGDFPGVPGVKVVGWDLGRGQSVILDGILTRDSAPSLPWVDGMDEVYLSAQRDHTHVGVSSESEEYGDAERAMHRAVTDAIHKALVAGRDHMEYVGSEEYAVEDIEANEREFYADGRLF